MMDKLDIAQRAGVTDSTHQFLHYEPELLTERDGFNAFVRRERKKPALADCAPLGTEVTDTDPRMIYHGEMIPVMTPDVAQGIKDARRTLRTNRFRPLGKRMSMIIDGCAGKSVLLLQIGRAYQGLLETERRPDSVWTPVVHINVPPRCESNLDWSLPFADFFGMDHTLNIEKRNYRSTDMTEPVVHHMKESRTSLILIDGVDRIHDSELSTAFDYFDSLQARLRVSIIYCGRDATDIVNEGLRRHGRSGRPHTSEQFRSNLPVMTIKPIPFRKGLEEDWRSVLKAYDKNFALYNHVPESLLHFEQFLHERTGGYMDTLDQLLCQTAQQAIEDGTEAITEEGLNDMIVGRQDSEDDWT
ncbi:ATP/GTP-binding protein [Streptomyces sp. NPDC046979]|uniref:ATP/GTP-binding protein n=1 Tax=Streptomyces sp. NPDC046979 TaxID=3154604 RepID=UPI0033DD50FB